MILLKTRGVFFNNKCNMSFLFAKLNIVLHLLDINQRFNILSCYHVRYAYHAYFKQKPKLIVKHYVKHNSLFKIILYYQMNPY